MGSSFNPYRQHIEYMVPRVISMCNRNSLSKHYGCFDRNFWHFKTIIDFPSATYQQSVLGFAQLHSDKNSEFYQNENLSQVIKSGVLYWCKIQNKDGSVDEYYQNDRSFCPTAFTTGAIAQSYYLTEDLFDSDEKKLIKTSIEKSCLWLSEHSFPIVQNQMVASMLSLYWGSKVLSSDVIFDRFKKRRREVLNSQTSEGWFPEYSGFDTGYSFKVLDLFSHYLINEKDDEILEAANRLVELLTEFIHPDGTIGGEYCSRQTQHVFPFCLEFLSKFENEKTLLLKKWFLDNLALDNIINPKLVDDKYLSYFYFNSYVMAYLNERKSSFETIKNPTLPTFKYYKEAGLIRIDKQDFKAWFSIYRKGTSKAYFKNKLIFQDNGYQATDGIKQICSQTEDRSTKFDIEEIEDTLVLKFEGNFGPLDDSYPLEKYIVPFKVVCRTFLKLDFLSYWFNSFLKKSKIASLKNDSVKIEKKVLISFDKHSIKTKDIVKGLNSSQTKTFRKMNNHSVVHSPSSRFCQIQSINYQNKKVSFNKKNSGLVECEYEINF